MLGDKIKKLREELGLNQEELAQKINVSASTIAMYETNKRQPNYETLSKISDLFGVTTDYLLGKTNHKNTLDGVKIAQANGINTDGLDEKEIEEVKRQVEFMKWKKQQENNK